MRSKKSVVWLAGIAMLLSLFMAGPVLAQDGKAALKHIPKETMLVVSINLKRLKGSKLYKDALGMVMADPSAKADFDKLKDATGFDIEKDLDGLVIAAAADFEESEQFLLIAKGQFDEKKFIEFAKAEGAEIKTAEHGGVTYYDVDDEAGMAFTDGYLVIGPKPALKAAIDTKGGKMDSVEKSAGLAAMFGAVDTSKDLWFAMELPESLRKEFGRELPMGSDVEKVWGALDLNAGLKLDITIGTAKEDTAAQLVQLATEGLKEAAADPNVAQLGLDKAISQTKVKQDGKNLTVNIKLSEEELDKIKGMLGAMMGGGF